MSKGFLKFCKLISNLILGHIKLSQILHYVGSTCQLLEQRLDEHKLNPKSAIYKYRDDNPIIELICNCPCKDKKNA